MPNVKKTSCIIDFISCILSSDMLMGYPFWVEPPRTGHHREYVCKSFPSDTKINSVKTVKCICFHFLPVAMVTCCSVDYKVSSS